jgi:glycosyltransferase involved in cell wall biosynthesis
VETVLVTFARCRDLCPELSPEFAVCFPGQLADELTAAGVLVHHIGRVRVSRPWTVLQARRRLRRLVRERGYQVVVFQMPWSHGLFAGAVEGTGAAAVPHYHNPPRRHWTDWLSKRHRPRLVVAPSRHSLEGWAAAFPGAETLVLYNPLPQSITAGARLGADDRARVRVAHGAEPGHTVILQASRLEEWKGHDLVLRALHRLKDRADWVYWVAGGAQRPSEAEHLRRLEEMVEGFGLKDRVRFLGHRTDVPVLMQAADVYCQGNHGPEGFSLAFVEASYCGLPIVTTALGGALEIVESDTGALVPVGDADALAGALAELIRSPARRAEMGRRARERVAELCDPGRQLRRYHDALAAVGSGRPAALARSQPE